MMMLVPLVHWVLDCMPAKGLLNWWQRFLLVCCRSFPGCHSDEVVCRFDQDLRRLLHLDLRYPAAVAATVRGTIDLDMPCVACSTAMALDPGRRHPVVEVSAPMTRCLALPPNKHGKL